MRRVSSTTSWLISGCWWSHERFLVHDRKLQLLPSRWTQSKALLAERRIIHYFGKHFTSKFRKMATETPWRKKATMKAMRRSVRRTTASSQTTRTTSSSQCTTSTPVTTLISTIAWCTSCVDRARRAHCSTLDDDTAHLMAQVLSNHIVISMSSIARSLSLDLSLLPLLVFLVLLRLLSLRRAVPWARQPDRHGKSALLCRRREWGHPELLHLSHRLWAQSPDLRRAQRIIGHLLPHDSFPGPRRGWRDTRQDAHRGTPRTSRILRTRRHVNSQSSSSVMFDGSGQPDREKCRSIIKFRCHTLSEDTQTVRIVDGSGQRDERNSSNAQIRTIWGAKTIIAEYRAKVSHHELQAVQAEEERRLLQGQLWRQKLEFREAHQRSLTEMKEFWKFESSTFVAIARRKLIEDQNTFLELSGRVQELQNEVNCMNDFKDFQDAESVCSGNSHVTRCYSQHIRYLKGCWGISFVSPCRREGPPSICGTFCISGNVFADPLASSSAPYPHELHQWNSSIEEPLHTVTVEKSERQEQNLDLRCQSGPSAKDSVLFSAGDSSKNYGADQQRLQISDLHFDKFPTPATFACWKMRFKTEVCTCSQFPTGAMQWIKEVELVDSVDELRSSSCRPRSRTVSFAADRLLTWSTITSGSLGAMVLSRTMPTYSLLVYEMMIFRNSIQSGTEFYCFWRKSHKMTSWKDCTKKEYVSLRNSRPYWNCMTWRLIRRS